MKHTPTLFDTENGQNPNGEPDEENDSEEAGEFKEIRYVGRIPHDWDVEMLDELTVKVTSGHTPKGGEKAYVDEGIPFIRSQNVRKGRLVVDDVAHITVDQHHDMSRSQLQPEDVLLNITGASIGRSCVVPEWLEEGNVNQHVCILRPTDRIHPKYLSLVLNGNPGQKQVHSFQAGGSREALNYGQIKSFKIPLPSFKEQRLIACILNKWDHAIEQVDSLVEKKGDKLHGLRQRLLTGRKRFPECVVSGDMKEVGIGKIPVDWRQKRLGDLFTWKTEKNEDNKIEKVITVGKDEIRDQEEHFNQSVASDDLSNYRIIEPGDFVYDPMSAYYGALGRYDLEEAGVVSPAYRVLQLNDGYHSDFVKFLLESHYVQFRIDASSLQNNKSGKRRGLRQDAFASIQVHIPPIEEQRRIAQTLGAAETEIQKLKEKREALKRQKKGLMQRLLTGTVRTV